MTKSKVGIYLKLGYSLQDFRYSRKSTNFGILGIVLSFMTGESGRFILITSFLRILLAMIIFFMRQNYSIYLKKLRKFLIPTKFFTKSLKVIDYVAFLINISTISLIIYSSSLVKSLERSTYFLVLQAKLEEIHTLTLPSEFTVIILGSIQKDPKSANNLQKPTSAYLSAYKKLAKGKGPQSSKGQTLQLST